jgi:hypothetical protein
MREAQGGSGLTLMMGEGGVGMGMVDELIEYSFA